MQALRGAALGRSDRSSTATIVLGLTILALLLRVPGLDAPLWYDEILSLVESVRPNLRHILTTYDDASHHPLFAVLSHLSVSTFGERPWVVRLPALLFGVASVPATYFLGTLVSGRREAILASLLLATSYHHIWFSQNARGYTALLFFTLLATWLLLKALKSGRAVWYAAYGVAAALGTYTHLTMLFVVIAQTGVCFWLTLRTPEDRYRWAAWRLPVVGLGVAGMVTLLLYAPMLRGLYAYAVEASHPSTHIATPALAAQHTIRGLQVGMNSFGLLMGVALGAIGAVGYLTRQPVTLAMFVLPGCAIAAGAVLLGPSVRPRFFFLLVGFAMLLIARGAVQLADWMRSHAIVTRESHVSMVASALVLVMVGLAVPSLLDNYRFPKQDFERARTYITEQRADDQPVVTAGTATYPFQRYYREPWRGVSTIAEFEVVRGRHPKFWVVYSQPEYIEPSLRAAIERSCTSSKVFHGTLGGGDVVVCEASRVPHTAYRAEGLP